MWCDWIQRWEGAAWAHGLCSAFIEGGLMISQGRLDGGDKIHSKGDRVSQEEMLIPRCLWMNGEQSDLLYHWQRKEAWSGKQVIPWSREKRLLSLVTQRAANIICSHVKQLCSWVPRRFLIIHQRKRAKYYLLTGQENRSRKECIALLSSLEKNTLWNCFLICKTWDCHRLCKFPKVLTLVFPLYQFPLLSKTTFRIGSISTVKFPDVSSITCGDISLPSKQWFNSSVSQFCEWTEFIAKISNVVFNRSIPCSVSQSQCSYYRGTKNATYFCLCGHP